MADSRGTPLQGNRATHSVATPGLHASDLEAGAPTSHNPTPVGQTGNVPMSDGSKWVATDVLTPTEHTAIGDGAPHHAAVTLGGGSDSALALSGQQLTLTLPAFVFTQTTVAAVSLTAGNIVNIYNDGGTLKAKLADCSLNLQADGYVLANYSVGNTATVYLNGFNTSLTGLTLGDYLYLSTVGGVTATAPTTAGHIVQPVGQALTATKALFTKEPSILLAT